MEKTLNSNNLAFLSIFVALILVAAALVFIFVKPLSKPDQTPVSSEETYRIVADDDDGPEQIFEKAFTLYSNAHNSQISADELRRVAEYMAETGLRGKAYWTDSLGVRHELWIGTGDEIVLKKNTATFNLSNAITDYKRKSVTINFGFEEAYNELLRLRASTK